ncbi:MAG TPA: hypothetical protein VIK33_18600 [Anaerolineae bacterium]
MAFVLKSSQFAELLGPSMKQLFDNDTLFEPDEMTALYDLLEEAHGRTEA